MDALIVIVTWLTVILGAAVLIGVLALILVDIYCHRLWAKLTSMYTLNTLRWYMTLAERKNRRVRLNVSAAADKLIERETAR